MKILKIVIVLFLFFEYGFSKGTISGFIFDFSTEKPISGIKIYIDDSSTFAVSDSMGQYVFDDLVEGKYLISIDRPKVHGKYVSLNMEQKFVEITESKLILFVDTIFIHYLDNLSNTLDVQYGKEYRTFDSVHSTEIIVVPMGQCTKQLTEPKEIVEIEFQSYSYRAIVKSKEDSLPVTSAVLRVSDTLGVNINDKGVLQLNKLFPGVYPFTIKSIDYKGIIDTIIIDSLNVIDTFYLEKKISSPPATITPYPR